MLFSLLANLAAIYNLIVLPAALVYAPDISLLNNGGSLYFLKQNYLEAAPYRISDFSLGMKVTALSAIIVDAESGIILWQKNPDQVQPIASLTKLISVLVFLDYNPGWETEVTVTSADLRAGGHIYQGEKLTVRDLFNLALIPSSNSAIMALTSSTGLSKEEFTARMNQKAAALDMKQAKFSEPTGLSPENVASATDIIKLARTAFSREEIRNITIQQEFTFQVLNNKRSATVKNTDKLLGSYLKINAGKTGSLDEAGYCLVSEVVGPAGQKIFVVVLGSLSDSDRFQDLKALAQWAFDNYFWPNKN